MFSFQKYAPDDKWGFAQAGHTPLKGLWNVIYAYMRICMWAVPFVTFFSIFSFHGKDTRLKLLSLVPLGFAAFYAGFYNLGMIDYGSRYYLQAYLVMIFLASGGVLLTRDLISKKNKSTAELFVPFFLLFNSIFMFFGVISILFPVLSKSAENSALMKNLEQAPYKKPVVIFFRDDPQRMDSLFTRNLPDFASRKTVYVLYLSPEENEELLKSLPGRQPLMVIHDNVGKRNYISPILDNEVNVKNLSSAAINYWKGVRDKEKAELLFLRALTIEPDNVEIMLMLGALYSEMNQYDKAISILRKASKVPGYGIALYPLGKALGESGNYKEAASVFEKLVDLNISPSITTKSKAWCEFYRKKIKQ